MKKPTWNDDAELRLKNVPIFVRPIVRRTVEKFARSKGYEVINTEVWEEAKKVKGQGM